jgi:hypothetical protein
VQKLAEHLRVGDTFPVGISRYRVHGICLTDENAVVCLYYYDNYDNQWRPVPVNSVYYWPLRSIVHNIETPRDCAPCYDSDCDCVYDSVR